MFSSSEEYQADAIRRMQEDNVSLCAICDRENCNCEAIASTVSGLFNTKKRKRIGDCSQCPATDVPVYWKDLCADCYIEDKY